MNEQNPNLEFSDRWIKVQPSLAAYIRSAIRDAQHSEDVLQEVARGAIEQFSEYDRSRPFLNWVMGIARYRILNYYRSQRSEKLIFGESVLVAIEHGHIKVAPSISDREQALGDCLDRLGGRAKDVLVGRYSDGVSITQIAERIGTTPNAVSRLLYRSRLLLKECIEDRILRKGVR